MTELLENSKWSQLVHQESKTKQKPTHWENAFSYPWLNGVLRPSLDCRLSAPSPKHLVFGHSASPSRNTWQESTAVLKGLNFSVRKVCGFFSFEYLEKRKQRTKSKPQTLQPWQSLGSFSELNHDFASFLLTPSASLNLQMCMRGEKKKSFSGRIQSKGKSENKNLDNKVQLQKGAHLVWENHYCSRMMYLQVTSVDIFYVPAGMFFVVPCSRYCSFITR